MNTANMADNCLFRLNGISKTRMSNEPGSNYVLDIPQLTIPAGKTIAIVGRSGVGKSTLLSLLGGLETVDAIDSSVAEFSLFLGSSTDQQHTPQHYDLLSAGAAFPWHRVGRVFQSGYLFPNISVALNIAAPLVGQGKKVTSKQLREVFVKFH